MLQCHGVHPHCLVAVKLSFGSRRAEPARATRASAAPRRAQVVLSGLQFLVEVVQGPCLENQEQLAMNGLVEVLMKVRARRCSAGRFNQFVQRS